MTQLFEKIGLFAAVILPLWNIPLMFRIIKRKSSEDISKYWLLGVWVCILLMLPSGLVSEDIVWRTFNIVNVIMFTSVVCVAMKYRK
jgi:uncharacterized protein with PQ loop repeat